jgi:hypothetical protein
VIATTTATGHQERTLASEGHARAVALLNACATRHGFLASTSRTENYRRIWARDGCVIGLAALLEGSPALKTTFRQTLATLATRQGPHGEIPSNVDPDTGRVSYGGTTGRVDADLWFLIGCGEYLRDSEDETFYAQIRQAVKRVAFLLGAWEFNNRGLLFIPPTGDWADEYVHSGYVLYDQLLYLQAKRSLALMSNWDRSLREAGLEDRIARLTDLIQTNYWFNSDDDPSARYHEVLYEKGRLAAQQRHASEHYWMPFFSPTGYGYRFDALANILASLLGVASAEQSRSVDEYIEAEVLAPDTRLVPAFHPVITREDEQWHKLRVAFSRTFKNEPYEYHNGGLWPMVTGFYAASLAARGRMRQADRFLQGVHEANRSSAGNGEWSFPEFIHAKRHVPGGTMQMGWSAAGAIIAHWYCHGKRLFGLPR